MPLPRKLLCPQCRNRGDGTCDACGGGGYVTPAENKRIIHGGPLKRALKTILKPDFGRPSITEEKHPDERAMVGLPDGGLLLTPPFSAPAIAGPPNCHIRGCGRKALPKMPICAPCRVAYLNGVVDGASGRGKPTGGLCRWCGHLPHDGIPCTWHGGDCKEAQVDENLWCPCDGKYPNWRTRIVGG